MVLFKFQSFLWSCAFNFIFIVYNLYSMFTCLQLKTNCKKILTDINQHTHIMILKKSMVQMLVYDKFFYLKRRPPFPFHWKSIYCLPSNLWVQWEHTPGYGTAWPALDSISAHQEDCYFLVKLVLCFFSCSASCQIEETQCSLDWVCTVGMPWSTVMGIAEDTKKFRRKMLPPSQKISCGEMALIIPGDIFRRLNYGSWNIFRFHFV